MDYKYPNLILHTYAQIHSPNKNKMILKKLIYFYNILKENVDKKAFLLPFLLFHLTFSFSQSRDAQLANEYYLNGEIQKSRDIYEKLSRNKSEIQHIHSNYLALLIHEKDFDAAEKYLKKVNKDFPGNIQYLSDLLYVYHLIPNDNEKNQLFKDLKKAYASNQFQLNQLAQKLLIHQLNEEALELLKMAREISGNPRAYALELASVYRILDRKDQMVEEYLNYGLINTQNTNYVKNLFQMLLTEEEDFDRLQQLLIIKVQQNPDELAYLELLIWVELQQKNFYGAFVQARAMDRRTGKPGDESMRIAQIAANNQSWEDAIEIYEYVVSNYPNSHHHIRARQQMLHAKESYLLSQVPIDNAQLIQLTNDYQSLFDELGASPITYEALKSKALLYAFYLDRKLQAIDILAEIIGAPLAPRDLKDESKLSLGDIYLLVDEPWEASLLYGQVQKDHKYDQLGYDARLRNARLYYFTGDFALANSYLKILKRATTKKISNDAIDLGLLINNNTILDTTDLAMKAFASIELLRYQHKNDSAITQLKSFIDTYPNHSLTDESYWLISKILSEQEKYEESIYFLDMILANHSTDILGDDAAFAKAKITEEKLKELSTAQELYRDFITKYPGSLYASEARKKFRLLRGDMIN